MGTLDVVTLLRPQRSPATPTLDLRLTGERTAHIVGAELAGARAVRLMGGDLAESGAAMGTLGQLSNDNGSHDSFSLDGDAPPHHVTPNLIPRDLGWA